MTRRFRNVFEEGEEGHALPFLGALVGSVGAVLLGIGAANDNSALDITGGIVTAVGFLTANILRHVSIDWELFRRTEDKK